jgi:putative DNA-invertase from lambdoid prophage Rac
MWQASNVPLGGAGLASAASSLSMTVPGAAAQFKRDPIIERTQAGMARAKAEGEKPGRQPTLSDKDRSDVRVALASGAKACQVAKRLA